MNPTKRHLAVARTLGVAIVAAVGFSGCATYADEFAAIDSRLDTLESRVQTAAQNADAANQSAQRANQRLDSIETRLQRLETSPGRVPRG